MNCKTCYNELVSKYRISIMGLAMISIMLYHQNWITDSVFFEWVRMLGYIGVEVFLFISGFGIAHSLRKNSLVQYYKNRAIRLFPACILFGICKIVLSYIPSMPPIQNLVLDFFSLSHWYIYAIVVYYLIAPVLYKMIGKWGGVFFLIVVLVTSLTICCWQYDADAPYLIKYGRWIVKRLPVFVLGMFVALRSPKLHLFKVTLFGGVVVLVNLIAFHFIILANASPTATDFFVKLAVLLPDRSVIPDNGRYLLDMLSVLFLVPLFAFVAYVMSKARIVFIINWIGTYSLEIYLCHQYIFKAVEHSSLFPTGAFIVGMGLSFTVAYIIGAIANPIKALAQNIFRT